MTSNNQNPYHAEHIAEFCSYADAGDRAISDAMIKEILALQAEIAELKSTVQQLQQEKTVTQSSTKKKPEIFESKFVVTEKSVKKLRDQIFSIFNKL